jgi:hypothetical protein
VDVGAGGSGSIGGDRDADGEDGGVWGGPSFDAGIPISETGVFAVPGVCAGLETVPTGGRRGATRVWVLRALFGVGSGALSGRLLVAGARES